MVDIMALETATHHVTLAEIKNEPKLADMALVTNSRLSVQPVTPAEWKRVCKMAGLDPARDTPGQLCHDQLPDQFTDLWLPPAARSFARQKLSRRKNTRLRNFRPAQHQLPDLIIWHTQEGFAVL